MNHGTFVEPSVPDGPPLGQVFGVSHPIGQTPSPNASPTLPGAPEFEMAVSVAPITRSHGELQLEVRVGSPQLSSAVALMVMVSPAAKSW